MKFAAAGVSMLCVAVVAGSLRSATAYRAARPDKTQLTFRHDARGQHASWDRRWEIAPGVAGKIGMIGAVARCGDEAFLGDPRANVVYRADLARETIVGRLAGTSERDRLDTIGGLAVDCTAQKLYVVDMTGVVVFDIASGGVDARFAKPATFATSIGPAIFDADTHTLAVPGLWPQKANDWLIKPVQQMFDGDRLGYQIDLTSGRTSPIVPAVERGCWSLGPNCVWTVLDRVRGSSAAAWVAAHRVGTLVGVFDGASQPLRAIDVRSPFFLDSNEQNGSRSIRDMVAWNERNSVVRGVFSFGSLIATVHTFNRTTAWKPGGRIDFDVFMNVHSLDGERVTSDIRLPDLPVGRDETSIYVVDYGTEGRKDLGARPITLVQIPVAANVERFY